MWKKSHQNNVQKKTSHYQFCSESPHKLPKWSLYFWEKIIILAMLKMCKNRLFSETHGNQRTSGKQTSICTCFQTPLKMLKFIPVSLKNVNMWVISRFVHRICKAYKSSRAWGKGYSISWCFEKNHIWSNTKHKHLIWGWGVFYSLNKVQGITDHFLFFWML